MKVIFRTFKISWNTYCLNYLCKSLFHGRHLIDSSSAHCSKSLTLPDVYAFILSTLLIALMGFPRLGAAFHTETAHELTQSEVYDVRHPRYVVPQCRPFDSRGLKCWLQLACYRVIQGSIIICITKQTAVGKLKMIKHVLPMYSWSWSSMLALDLSSSNSFLNGNRTGDHPHWKSVELHAMPNFDPYIKHWPMLCVICVLMSIRRKLNSLYFVPAVASQLQPLSVHIPSRKCYYES